MCMDPEPRILELHDDHRRSFRLPSDLWLRVRYTLTRHLSLGIWDERVKPARTTLDVRSPLLTGEEEGSACSVDQSAP